MTKTTIIKDERGRIEIQVDFICQDFDKEPHYNVRLFYTSPTSRRRKELPIVNDFILVTKQEIHEAKLALWEDLKPKL